MLNRLQILWKVISICRTEHTALTHIKVLMKYEIQQSKQWLNKHFNVHLKNNLPWIAIEKEVILC